MTTWPASPFVASENHDIVDDEIDDSRYAHGYDVTQENIPTCEFLNQQNYPEPKKKYRGTGQIISKIKFEIPLDSCIRSVSGSVFPDIEIGNCEVDGNCTLKGYCRGEYIFSPISLGKHEVRQNP